MDDIRERINALAQVRGQSPEEVLSQFGEAALHKAPSRYSKHIPMLRSMRFSGGGVEGDFAYILTENGRKLYGFPSQRNHRNQFKFVADTMPAHVTEDTFLVALDATQRYLTNFGWPPAEMLPAIGGTVVELGAYLGHKTMRFADTVGLTGKVLAVEMMAENVKVLQKNAAANGYGDLIDVEQIGVWSAPGEIAVRSKGRQRNSLADIGNLDETDISVPVDSIDNILDRWGIDQIDFLYISINGVEAEALRTLDRRLSTIKVIFVAAPYTDTEGRRNSDNCREILTAKGRTIVDVGNRNRVIAL